MILIRLRDRINHRNDGFNEQEIPSQENKNRNMNTVEYQPAHLDTDSFQTDR